MAQTNPNDARSRDRRAGLGGAVVEGDDGNGDGVGGCGGGGKMNGRTASVLAFALFAILQQPPVDGKLARALTQQTFLKNKHFEIISYIYIYIYI